MLYNKTLYNNNNSNNNKIIILYYKINIIAGHTQQNFERVGSNNPPLTSYGSSPEKTHKSF